MLKKTKISLFLVSLFVISSRSLFGESFIDSKAVYYSLLVFAHLFFTAVATSLIFLAFFKKQKSIKSIVFAAYTFIFIALYPASLLLRKILKESGIETVYALSYLAAMIVISLILFLILKIFKPKIKKDNTFTASDSESSGSAPEA